MRRLLLLLVALPLLVAGREPPPEISEQPASPRNFTIRGNGLTITVGEHLSYLRFSGGVECTNQQLKLAADVLELDIATAEVTAGGEFQLPSSSVPKERAVADPGAAVKQMASELKVPSARFSARALRRVGAAGNVRVSTDGIRLTTAGLVSLDGGVSWATSGRSMISRTEHGEQYSVSADSIVYDSAGGRALARGGISGSYQVRDEPAIALTADELELDTRTSQVRVSGNVRASRGTGHLESSEIRADLQARTAVMDRALNATYDSGRFTLAALTLRLDNNGTLLVAAGSVKLTDHQEGLVLTADKVQFDLEQEIGTASGEALVTHGGSHFRGDPITVRLEHGKTIIETSGPQQARINLDDPGVR